VRATVVPPDLAADGAAKVLFDAAVAALGALDIVVLNASVQIPCDWLGITRSYFKQQMAVNYRSPLPTSSPSTASRPA
jgi:NAD(P)-dependent dehydrogenase (short-subunit alcohol dehydrogenase family)